MSTKIIHLADTHIKLVRYHEEYQQVFQIIYNRIKQEKPDFIVHCGDIVHNKTTLSPEILPMISSFLQNLADIAPLYIVLGNHDGVLKNLSRMDSISPIVQQLNHPNIFYSRNSAVYHPAADIDLYCWSPFDKDNWHSVQNHDKTNIVMFHGSVTGVKTDIGYTFSEGEAKVSDFDEFDYAFLGDIHKSNQSIDELGKKRYCGSTIQQDFGETDDKGFLIWNIENKHKFSVKHVAIPHPKPFVTVPIDESGNLPSNLSIKSGSRVRLVPKTILSYDKIKSLTAFVQNKFNPEYVNYVNKSQSKTNIVSKSEIREAKNIRDIAVQEVLIDDFLQDYNISPDVRNKIFQLNKHYNTEVAANDTFLQNVFLEIQETQWENLYNYGSNNKINFQSLNGVVGVFGKNYSGKSSIFDSLLLSLFNSDSKSPRKNVHYVNENKDIAKTKTKIKVGDMVLCIERTIEKYIKKVKGGDAEEGKVDVLFSIEKNDNVYNKTQESRNLTDLEIQKYIGTLENFLLSTMAAQGRGQQFLELGTTERKKIVAKFLDLDFFDKQHVLAKERAKELSGILGNSSGIDFDSQIQQIILKQEENDKQILEQQKQCDLLKQRIHYFEQQCQQFKEQMSEKLKIIDIEELTRKKTFVLTKIKELQSEQQNLKQQYENSLIHISYYEKLLSQTNIDELRKKQKSQSDIAREFLKVVNQIKQEEAQLKVKNKKSELLKEVPCGPEFSHCRFIKDAWKSKNDIQTLEEQIRLLKVEEKSLQKKQENVDFEHVLREYDDYSKKLQKEQSSLDKCKILEEKNELLIKSHQSTLEQLLKAEQTYEQNREKQQRRRLLEQQYDDCQKRLKGFNKELTQCEAEHLNLFAMKGKLSEKLEANHIQKEKYQDYIIEFSANEILSKAYHPNGLPFQIIKQKLPILNEEIRKCLHGIVDFDVFLKADEKRLDIFIQHPKYNPRPIEGCSGAEKALASMAFRLALLSVSNLPKSNIFILDEPGTSLDEDNLDGFIKMLQMIKENFQVVFLISHMEALKDVVDSIIEIENINGFAHVEV